MKSGEDILQERARKISGKRSGNHLAQEEMITVVEFNLMPENYAIDEFFVSEVILLKELTTIPGVPSFVAGITNIRGKIISVVNLKIFLGITTKGITDLNRIIVLKHKQMEFGILADSILGTKTINTSALSPAPITVQGAAAGFVKGITSDGMIVLDGGNILSTKSIIINQKQK
jgi:purine-binding chemotaxis protein CheW